MMMLAQAANALRARFEGADVRFEAVSTDTRTIQHGDLFIALKGENFDGAKFVAQAAKAGAVAAVVNQDSGCGIQDTGCAAQSDHRRITHPVSRIPYHVSRITDHASRISHPGPPVTCNVQLGKCCQKNKTFQDSNTDVLSYPCYPCNPWLNFPPISSAQRAGFDGLAGAGFRVSECGFGGIRFLKYT